MGVQREAGYSATIAAYLVAAGRRVGVAKINREYVTLSDPCELAPDTEAYLNVIVDEKKSTRMIVLNDGVTLGQREVRYSVLAPF